MYNYYGHIIIATSSGRDYFDTRHVSSFAMACVEIGRVTTMFPSCAILKCEVIDITKNTSTTIWETDEHSKECSCRFAKENENYRKMCSVLEKRWNSLNSAQTEYDNYLYGESKFPDFN